MSNGEAKPHVTEGNSAGSRPVPDPTQLTTEALQREVASLKELLELRIAGVKDAAVAHADLADTKIDALEDQVSQQFQLVERQRVEQKADTALAVGAALSAAKEAVKEQTTASALSITKSETATAEQLKQLNTTFTTAINGVTTALADTKTRIERIENAKQGAVDSRGVLFATLGGLVGLAGIAIALIR